MSEDEHPSWVDWRDNLPVSYYSKQKFDGLVRSDFCR